VALDFGRASGARRIATSAAYGGGGLVGMGAAAAGVLVAEGLMAKRAIGLRKEAAPYADGYYGPKRRGTSLRFVMLGDSTAAGLGASSALETPGALISQGIVEAADRPVRYVNMATVGARSTDFASQVTRALIIRPHVVLVMIGANDVTHLVRPQTAVRHLAEGVSRLVEAGVQVVVGTCPDIGTIKPIRQPLRLVARRLSRQLAAAQTIAVVEAGGRTVSFGDLLGPEFDAHPEHMFALDRFHPSSIGYAAVAQAMMPSVLAAMGLVDPNERLPDPALGDVLMPVAQAAISAADTVGTEVVATKKQGDQRGPRGRWVQIRHRITHPLPKPEQPAPLSADIPGAEGPTPPPGSVLVLVRS